MPTAQVHPSGLTKDKGSKPGLIGRIKSWFSSVGVSGLVDFTETFDGNSEDDESKHHLHFHFHGQSHSQSGKNLETELEARTADRSSHARVSAARNSRLSKARSKSIAVENSLSVKSQAPAVSSVPEDESVREATPRPMQLAAGSAGYASLPTPPPANLGVAAKGWQGSQYHNIVDGVHEHRNAIKKRKQLRTLPEINNLVAQLWGLSVKRLGMRMTLRDYMDYHLSCFYFVTAMEEGKPIEQVGDSIDLFFAWENAVCDWLSDTDECLKKYGNRSLHFDSFRDSVFELIDLYTPTTDSAQYVGYLKQLIKQIAATDSAGTPLRWRHPWPKVTSNAKKLTEVLRGALVKEGEAKLSARFGEWHGNQEEGRKEVIRDEADVNGEGELTDEQLNARYDAWDELMPQGLAQAYEELVGGLVVRAPHDVERSEVALVGVFRMLDVDLSGGISSKDVVNALIHHTKTPWLASKGRSRFNVMRMLAKSKSGGNGSSSSIGSNEESPPPTQPNTARRKSVTK